MANDLTSQKQGNLRRGGYRAPGSKASPTTVADVRGPEDVSDVEPVTTTTPVTTGDPGAVKNPPDPADVATNDSPAEGTPTTGRKRGPNAGRMHTAATRYRGLVSRALAVPASDDEVDDFAAARRSAKKAAGGRKLPKEFQAALNLLDALHVKDDEVGKLELIQGIRTARVLVKALKAEELDGADLTEALEDAGATDPADVIDSMLDDALTAAIEEHSA